MSEFDDDPVYVKVSPELVRRMNSDWSQPVMVRIVGGKIDNKGVSVLELEFRNVPSPFPDESF